MHNSIGKQVFEQDQPGVGYCRDQLSSALMYKSVYSATFWYKGTQMLLLVLVKKVQLGYTATHCLHFFSCTNLHNRCHYSNLKSYNVNQEQYQAPPFSMFTRSQKETRLEDCAANRWKIAIVYALVVRPTLQQCHSTQQCTTAQWCDSAIVNAVVVYTLNIQQLMH